MLQPQYSGDATGVPATPSNPVAIYTHAYDREIIGGILIIFLKKVLIDHE